MINDIYIEPNELNNVITALKHDRELINDLLVKIYENIIKLDDDVWNSPEKRKITEELIPYLQKKKEIYINKLDSEILVLTEALDNYVKTNNIILKNTENLFDSKNIVG